MSASHFRIRGQSLEPTIHSRGRKCDPPRARKPKDRDTRADFEGQSLELLVHRGVA
jgi:hypothetical protein